MPAVFFVNCDVISSRYFTTFISKKMGFTSAQRDELLNMLLDGGKKDFFQGSPCAELFQQHLKEIVESIAKLSENEILNVSTEQYASYLESQHTLEFPVLREEERTISSREVEVPPARVPAGFRYMLRDLDATMQRSLIIFHVPFSGDIDLLRYRSTTFNTSGGESLKVDGGELLFEYINFYNKPETIEEQYNADLRSFKQKYARLQKDFSIYHVQLKSFATQLIEERKKTVLDQLNFVSSFNIPVKRKTDAPATFSVPAPALRKKIMVAAPVFDNAIFKPDPTIRIEDYREILKLLNDVGKNFERMPSTYRDKGEEDLRDHMLLVLDPNFEMGSATGETFNKSGKTDIQLRYSSSVLFIAECKFWTGEKGLSDTIGQLLSYLTWRDSKTAIILFVRNKEITSVLQKMEQMVLKHPQYLRKNQSVAENWQEYILHLNGDPNKEILMTILVFHLAG